MYIAPNGMKFKDYWESMEYNRAEIKKDLDSLLKKHKSICPICKNKCIKSTVSGIYICGNCNKAFSLEGEDESKG